MSDLTALTVRREDAAIDAVKVLQNIVLSLRNDVLKSGVDYGIIPGTGDKPTLLLPGMEKLMRALRLRPEYNLVSSTVDFDKPLFYYRYECRMVEVETGLCVSTSIGSANSYEGKWRYRKAARLCPTCGKETIIKGKAEYGGGWLCFAKKGGCGAKFGENAKEIVDQPEGRVLNDDIFDQINTIDKIAQKRALSSAIKGAANVSEYFTVDLDDLHRFDTDVVDAEFVEVARLVDKATGEIVEAKPDPDKAKELMKASDTTNRLVNPAQPPTPPVATEPPATPVNPLTASAQKAAAQREQAATRYERGKVIRETQDLLFGGVRAHAQNAIAKMERENVLSEGMSTESAIIAVRRHYWLRDDDLSGKFAKLLADAGIAEQEFWDFADETRETYDGTPDDAKALIAQLAEIQRADANPDQNDFVDGPWDWDTIMKLAEAFGIKSEAEVCKILATEYHLNTELAFKEDFIDKFPYDDAKQAITEAGLTWRKLKKTA